MSRAMPVVPRPPARAGYAPMQVRAGVRRSILTLPALWMMVALLAAGAWRFGSVLRRSFSAYPVATSVALALFALYAIPFIMLLRVIDYLEGEPIILQATAMAWGGLVATSAAIAGSAALQDILAKLVSPAFAADWGPAVAAAALEELLKVLGVVAIALVGRGQIRSVVDGFVYGALVGLGFQVVENIVFSVNAVALAGGEDEVGPVLVTFLLRGFIGGLWSHTLFTALAGAGVAYAMVRRDRSPAVRGLVAAGLMLSAWGFHFLWNSPLLGDGFGYGILGVLAALLLKGVPALALGVTLIMVAERREADYYSAVLASLGDPRIATPDEIRALVSPRRRVAARRGARLRAGLPGARAVRRLQKAQALLAVALAKDPSREPGPEVLQRRRAVLARRHQLTALGLAAGVGPTRRTAALQNSAVMVVQALVIGVLVAGVGIAIRVLGGS